MSVQELPRAENGCIDGNLSKYDDREKCDRCRHPNPIGFQVPDDVWEAVKTRAEQAALAESRRDSTWAHDVPKPPYNILCLPCFVEVADWHGIEWAEGIEFFPLSRCYVTALNMWLDWVIAGGAF